MDAAVKLLMTADAAFDPLPPHADRRANQSNHFEAEIALLDPAKRYSVSKLLYHCSPRRFAEFIPALSFAHISSLNRHPSALGIPRRRPLLS